MMKLLSSFACCAALLLADFQISHWRYRRALPAAPESRTVAINLDRTVYVSSQPSLADVRIVKGEAEEVPYVLEKLSGTHGVAEISSSILNREIHGSDLELTIDAGAGHRHNGIRLATQKTNFRQRVGISTSDDGRNWTRVRDDGYIFDFSGDGRHVAVLEVPYSDSTRRFVKIAIHGWTDPRAVERCWVTFKQDRPAVRDTMAALKPEPQQEAKTKSTLYPWDLGTRGIPHDQLSVEVSTAAFDRAASVESSDDGKEWAALGTGVLSRIGQQVSLDVDFPENHQRYLRLRIYNRDDHPLAVTGATLSVIRTRVKFKPVAGATYWLYYGNPDAVAPAYDLAAVLSGEAPRAENTIGMEAEEHNPAFREKPSPPKPWTEQHPAILYAILGVAVIGMGVITIRLLGKARAETS